MTSQNRGPSTPPLDNAAGQQAVATGSETRQNRETADEIALPRIAGALRERVRQAALQEGDGRGPRTVVDAGKSYRAVDHELLWAYETEGRRLHAQASVEILVGLFGQLGRLAKRALSAAGKWFSPEPTRQYRLEGLYRRGSSFEVPFHYQQTLDRYLGQGL